MRYIIPILTFILFLFGLFIFSVTILSGVGIYTPILTISTLVGLTTLLINRKTGLIIILFVCLGWLLRYFEHASFLLLYDIKNIDRWILVSIPIFLSTFIFILTCYSRQKVLFGKSLSLKHLILLVIVIASIGLFSFVRKTHVNEFNCWYYIDKNKVDFKITFAKTPNNIFETTIDSDKLKQFVLKYGILDEYRVGIYCPETRVKVVTRFKKIIAIEILGFRNSTTGYKATLDKPVELDINKIYGDKEILLPDFPLGD